MTELGKFISNKMRPALDYSGSDLHSSIYYQSYVPNEAICDTGGSYFLINTIKEEEEEEVRKEDEAACEATRAGTAWRSISSCARRCRRHSGASSIMYASRLASEALLMRGGAGMSSSHRKQLL